MSIVPDYKYFLSLGLGRPLPPPSWNSSNFMQFFFFEGFPNLDDELNNFDNILDSVATNQRTDQSEINETSTNWKGPLRPLKFI